MGIRLLARDAPALLILLPLNAGSLGGRQSTAVRAIATHLAAQSNLLRLDPRRFRIGEGAVLTSLVDTCLLIRLALNDGLFGLQA